MRFIGAVFFLLFNCLAVLAQSLQIEFQSLESENGHRGISAINDLLCYVSGPEGGVYQLKVGEQPKWRGVRDCPQCDFRDIHAFSEQELLVISAGQPARIYRSEDAGLHWERVFEDLRPEAFYDGMDFWDSARGIAFGDAIGDYLLLLSTEDRGRTWQAHDSILKVKTGQGGFAASGTSIRCGEDGFVAIGLGGPEATLCYSKDFGRTWQQVACPLDSGASTKGIFSIDYLPSGEIIAVGGDYRGAEYCNQQIAVGYEKASIWYSKAEMEIDLPPFYHSAVEVISETDIILASRFGLYYTLDKGTSWHFSDAGFYSLSLGEHWVWATGPKGKVARLRILQ